MELKTNAFFVRRLKKSALPQPNFDTIFDVLGVNRLHFPSPTDTCQETKDQSRKS